MGIFLFDKDSKEEKEERKGSGFERDAEEERLRGKGKKVRKRSFGGEKKKTPPETAVFQCRFTGFWKTARPRLNQAGVPRRFNVITQRQSFTAL